ncbi:hypothetical protein OG713_34775 [Streptomyces sp. NBC_00723]|uniref:hypothetical protein n=1 Tax=Streptomyces sp. NBC_00723 TaxID=2903673 RepID=UPI003867036B
MGFFSGSFKGQSNEQVLRDQFDSGMKAIAARKKGSRDELAESREAAASREMQSRYREENANPQAALAISRWGRKR